MLCFFTTTGPFYKQSFFDQEPLINMLKTYLLSKNADLITTLQKRGFNGRISRILGEFYILGGPIQESHVWRGHRSAVNELTRTPLVTLTGTLGYKRSPGGEGVLKVGRGGRLERQRPQLDLPVVRPALGVRAVDQGGLGVPWSW